MIRLTARDYALQPWKNGRGHTTEFWRHEENGQLLIRLSRATVAEDGAFSLFPGVERNLTVITGPGFRLTGTGHDLRCDPLLPVAFPGDILLTATETEAGTSDDFNVMTARHLPRPVVTVESDGARFAAGNLLALYALGDVTVNDTALHSGEMILTKDPTVIAGRGPVIAARLPL